MQVSTGRECHLTAADESGKREVIHPPDNSSHVDSEDEYVNLQTIPVAMDFPCATEEQEVMVSKVSCGSRHTAVVTGQSGSRQCNAVWHALDHTEGPAKRTEQPEPILMTFCFGIMSYDFV